MNLAFVVLTLAALQAPGAAKAAPMTVQVEASTKDAPGLAEWARELRTALEARKDEFQLAKPGEKAELVVRLDSVGGDASGASILNGALELGEVKRPFRYGFTNVRAEAEKLARNLRRLADQMKAGAR